MKRVLIVDDHPVTRLAVRMLMERHGFEVIAETDNGAWGFHAHLDTQSTLTWTLIPRPLGH